MITNRTQILLLIVSSLVIQGCSSQLKQTQSGFLQDYSQLKLVKEYQDTMVYEAEFFDKNALANVKSLKLVPFEIWVKQTDAVGINTEQLKKMHQYFHRQLKEKLQVNYRIVNRVEENTLTIRGAFSGVKIEESSLSATDFIPIRIVLNAGNSAYLTATNQKDVISEVSIEAEFLLGLNTKRAFAMTATKQLDTTVKDASEGNFDAVTKVLDIWINNFVKKLNAVKY